MKHLSPIHGLITLLLVGCSMTDQRSAQEQYSKTDSAIDYTSEIDKLNKRLTSAIVNKDFNSIKKIYTDSSLLLAAYQPMIDGKDQIGRFYEILFDRQPLKSYTKTPRELFNFEQYILEIGTFKKELLSDSTLEGKYFSTWIKSGNQLFLRAEGFGFFGVPPNPADHRVMTVIDESEPLKGRNGKVMPMEVQAYHALGENRVRDRDTRGVIDSYTSDAIYYPYADTAKTGNIELTDHFKAYHKNPVTIDSIETWSYDIDPVADGIIRYSKFYVTWTLPNGYSGISSGTGMAYWRRMPDRSLKIHRQLATHTYNP